MRRAPALGPTRRALLLAVATALSLYCGTKRLSAAAPRSPLAPSRLAVQVPDARGPGWKTYRSRKLHFEVSYPPYLAPETPKEIPSFVGFLDGKLSGTGCYEFDVQVKSRGTMTEAQAIADSNLFWTKKQAQSFYGDHTGRGAFPFAAALANAYFIGGGMMDPELHPVERKTLNGYLALIGKSFTRCYYDQGGIAGSGKVKVVFLLGKRHYAAIDMLWESADADAMLSSFRFINPNSPR